MKEKGNSGDGCFEDVSETERDSETSLNPVNQKKDPTKKGIQVREGEIVRKMEKDESFQNMLHHEVTDEFVRKSEKDESGFLLDSERERQETTEKKEIVVRGSQENTELNDLKDSEYGPPESMFPEVTDIVSNGIDEVRGGQEAADLKDLNYLCDVSEIKLQEVAKNLSKEKCDSRLLLKSVIETNPTTENGTKVREGREVNSLKGFKQHFVDGTSESIFHEVANKVVSKRKDDAELLFDSVAAAHENGIEVRVDKKSSGAKPVCLPFPQNHSVPKKKRTPRVKTEILPGESTSRRPCNMDWHKQFGNPEFAADWIRRWPMSRNRTVKEVQKLNVCQNNRTNIINNDDEPEVPNNNDDEPEVPNALRGKIEEKRGSNPVLVIMKRLFATDLSSHHGRLSIPLNQIRRNFLTTRETEALKIKGEFINVSLIEPCLDVNSSIRLTKWNDMYMLITGWKSVIGNKRNGLEKNDMVQLWSFRCNEDKDLWFALVKV